MKIFNDSVMVGLLLPIIACPSLPPNATLQSVDVTDSDYFPEGGEFLLSSEQDSFTLKEIGYLKHRKRDFTYFFKASRLEAAYYVDYR